MYGIPQLVTIQNTDQWCRPGKECLVRFKAIPSIGMIVVLSVLVCCYSWAAGPSAEPVSSELAQRAACLYAQQKWLGCSLASITPYFALDGSVNAYAAQFAKHTYSTADGTQPQVGTVIVSARYDVYPLIERFSGPAPHVAAAAALADAVGVGADPLGRIVKSYFLGPMRVLHEVSVSGRGSTLVDEAGRPAVQANLTTGSGRLAPSPLGNLPFTPREMWESIDSGKAVSTAAASSPATRMSSGESSASSSTGNMINDLPCLWGDYRSADPRWEAEVEVTAYWDRHGYGNIVDNAQSFYVPSYTALSGDFGRVFNLPDVDFDPPVDETLVAPAMMTVLNSPDYGNDLAFNVVYQAPFSWADITNEIDHGRPFIYHNLSRDAMQNAWLYSAGIGYSYDTYHMIYIHPGYGYPVYGNVVEINYDAIPSDTQGIYKVSPNGTPTFDCYWSENFDVGYDDGWPMWTLGKAAASPGGWAKSQMHHHRPRGGGMSAFCDDAKIATGGYRGNLDDWAQIGPFSTRGKTSGEVSAYVWQNLAPGDALRFEASTDGANWSGMAMTGSYTNWTKRILDLTNVFGQGNLMNKPKVWFRLRFTSGPNGGTGGYEGAYVDDLVIKLNGSGLPPDPPTGIWASSGLYTDKVVVSWNEVPGAVSYRVYRSDISNGTYTELGGQFNNPPTEAYYEDLGATPGVNYFYKVLAWDYVGRGQLCYDYAMGWKSILPPANVVASRGLYTDSIHVSWDPVSGAGYYRVYRALSPGGTKTALGIWQAGTSFVDTGLSPGVDYTYWVMAAVDSTIARTSGYSAWSQGYMAIAAPTGLNATQGFYSNKVHLSWNTVPGANYYRVYTSTLVGATPVVTPLSGWLISNAYDHTTAVPGQTYTYIVTASVGGSGEKESSYSSSADGWALLSPPTGLTATDGSSSAYVRISWQAATGGNYYQVYRAPAAGGALVAISSWVSGTSYDDTSATPGIDYRYYAEAAADANGTHASAYSSSDAGWRALPAPALVVATDGAYTDKVAIGWSPVSGASAYRVTRAVATDGLWTDITGWVNQLNFNDVNASPGRNYYYRVYAALDGAGTRQGSYGQDTGWRAAMSAPTNVVATDGAYSDKVRVTWDAVSGASSYCVFRSTTSTGDDKVAISGWVNVTAFDDTGSTPGTDCYYWVCASSDAQGNTRGLFASDAGWRALLPPTGVSATDGLLRDRIRVTWNPVVGATHYALYRWVRFDTYSLVGSWQTSLSCDDTTRPVGSAYTYVVRAAISDAGLRATAYSASDTGFRGLALSTPEVKVMPDSPAVPGVLSGVVAATLGDCFYIENSQRTAGIRVEQLGYQLSIGMMVDVTGSLYTTSWGERCVQALTAIENGSGTVSPLGMTNKTLGGGDRFNMASGGGQLGVTGGVGVNTIGLLVTTTGSVVAVDPMRPSRWFTIDDGSGSPVKVVAPIWVVVNPGWNFASVTGICACESDGQGRARVIRVRGSSDIVAY